MRPFFSCYSWFKGFTVPIGSKRQQIPVMTSNNLNSSNRCNVLPPHVTGSGILYLSRRLRDGGFLVSPSLAAKPAWRCFQFWYYIRGETSVYKPKLQLYRNGSSSADTQIWSSSEEALQWQFVQVPLKDDDNFKRVSNEYYASESLHTISKIVHHFLFRFKDIP